MKAVNTDKTSELFANCRKAKLEELDRHAQWDELESREGVPKRGWHVRKLPGTGPMSVRVYHNGEMVRAVQKVSFEIDAEHFLPRMKLEILMLADQIALDFDEDEQIEIERKPITAKSSPFPTDAC